MNDLHVSATTVAAVLLWTTGLVLAVVDLATSYDTGALGVIVAGGGGVLTVRAFFVHMIDLERNAFELGRDYQSHRDDLHSI